MRIYLYNWLLKAHGILRRLELFEFFWHKLTQPVFATKTKLFGKKILLPSVYRFPVTIRDFSTFNNPLLELIYQVYIKEKRKLTIVDVGAAVGDTFIFVKQNIPEAVGTIFCIEPHAIFSEYLKQNVKEHPEAIVLEVTLSDKNEKIKSLIQIHESTASAQGGAAVVAKPLDEVEEIRRHPIDIIKIDVDGFDGKILAGAKEIIRTCNPAIIFEFHPLLIKTTGNDPYQPFAVLKECGYEELVWYNKFGEFEHSGTVDEYNFVARQINACLEIPEDDKHFDVIALASNCNINRVDLAACKFARKKRFKF